MHFPDWCGLRRLTGNIDFLNQCWSEYTGVDADEIYGWGWRPAIHPDDLPELLEC